MAVHNKELEELIKNFALFDNWEERYRYLIDMGRKLPVMDESLKTDDNLVRGCTSRVWMVTNVKDNIFTFISDSDAHIVRGLIYILYQAYNGKTLEQVKETDINAAFQQIGLDQHLSPNRRNGFFAMVDKIRSLT